MSLDKFLERAGEIELVMSTANFRRENWRKVVTALKEAKIIIGWQQEMTDHVSYLLKVPPEPMGKEWLEKWNKEFIDD